MNNRQRVIDAINFKKTDYVPYTADFTMQARDRFVSVMGEACLHNINNHLTVIDLTKPQVEIKEGYFQDEYGVVWNKTGADKDIGVPDQYWITNEADFERYSFPPVDEAFVRGECERLMASSPDNFRGMSIGFSMFERLWTLMGMEDALCNMVLEPELVHRILKRVCERNLAILDIALTYDYDFFHFGDDWGQQKGLIMGPAHWRTFIKPYVARMYERVKQSGKYVSQHSCGDIREIIDDLYEMGLNAYQTFQPEIYGLDYSKKLYGKIAIWGGISTQYDLPSKTPDEIRDITRKTINQFKETGGLIAAPTHSIPGDVPVENIVAMLEVFAAQ